jgi:hypothetical protein
MLLFEADRKPLQNVEHVAAGLAACSLTAFSIHRLIQLSMEHRETKLDGSILSDDPAQHHLYSGIIPVAMVVTFISSATNWIMFFFDTPILIDKMTGCKVYMIRWCAWTVLSFAATYLIESVDSSSNGKERITGLGLALTQGVSSFCGLLLPIVSSSAIVWTATILFAVATFLLLFLRLKEKMASTKTARANIKALRDAASVVSFEQYEDLGRREAGLFLLRMCGTIWSYFVLSYFAEALGSRYPSYSMVPPQQNLESSQEYNPYFVADCVIDMTTKVLYVSVIIDSYAKLFSVNRAVSEANDATSLAERHETEKLDVATTTAREGNTKRSFFERHEVKNGLLASIGLLESLTDAQAHRTSSSSRDGAAPEQKDEVASLSQLHTTLAEMLNTVISEVNMLG